MRSGTLAALALGVVVSAGTSADLAAAAEYAARTVYRRCHCAREWAHREYWQWDHRPIWDDPSLVLKPNFWGSPAPHLVPADIWARKWHLPWLHHRLHRRHARRDP
jgi:hypothetical protein